MMMPVRRVCIGFFSFLVRDGFVEMVQGAKGMGNGGRGGRQGAVRCCCKIPIGGPLQESAD